MIHLNFVSLEVATPATIFRRSRTPDEARASDSWIGSKLPKALGDDEWLPYWVSLEPAVGFSPFLVNVDTNRDLGKRILLDALLKSASRQLRPDEFTRPKNPFIQELALKMGSHEEGDEELTIQPYYLAVAKKFGFLTDFHFRMRSGYVFDRRVQQLSLSLNKQFRRNTDYYVDRTSKLRQFLIKRWPLFEDVRFHGAGATSTFSKEFLALDGEKLQPKTYLFHHNKEKQSQFAGLKEFGPLQEVRFTPRLLFMFREQDRASARRLAVALRGGKQQDQYNWPGFQAIFKTQVEIDPQPVILADLEEHSMRSALAEAERRHADSKGLIPVLVLPNGDDNGYLTQKAIFAHASIPTQVCTLRILDNDDSLKWAVANLALQIFCKLGGKPWKVKPQDERSLIVGISHSHKTHIQDEKTVVDKYFAFSVLTDSTGLFQKVQILGDESDHDTYIDSLSATLKQTLETQSQIFDRVVIHTSFKLKYDEMTAIRSTVHEVARNSTCRFAVIKVNQNARFFGTNRNVNSLVPYEGTRVKLGFGEYLVWFEGLSPTKPNVMKAYPGPTHLQFLRFDDDLLDRDEEIMLLQELVNLSGANWRGFNAKSAPVSVFYCHLVADLVHDFHEHGLPMPATNDEHPWFL